MNSARLRQLLSTVYASDTRLGSQLFQPSSAARTFSTADSCVKGGTGARISGILVTLRLIGEACVPLAVPRALEQEPGAPLRLVDPVLQQTRRRQIVRLIAQRMGFTHTARKLRV